MEKQNNCTGNVILVDTPGFEETGPNSAENVLKQVVKWMNQK